MYGMNNKKIFFSYFLFSTFIALSCFSAEIQWDQYKIPKFRIASLQQRFSKPESHGKKINFQGEKDKKSLMEYANFFEYGSSFLAVLSVWEEGETSSTLYTFIKEGKNWSPLQSINEIEVDSAEVAKFYIGDHIGFTIATISQRVPNAYLYDKIKRSFYRLDLSKMGNLTKLPSSKTLIYGHHLCGCGGECWVSHLAKFENRKFNIIATQGCDCKNYYVTKVDHKDNSLPLEKQRTCSGQTGSVNDLTQKWEKLVQKYHWK